MIGFLHKSLFKQYQWVCLFSVADFDIGLVIVAHNKFKLAGKKGFISEPQFKSLKIRSPGK